jgi:hypothetical protein
VGAEVTIDKKVFSCPMILKVEPATLPKLSWWTRKPLYCLPYN